MSGEDGATAPAAGAGPATVTAVVPAFEPGPGLVAVVRSVLGQAGAVVVVDDGSSGPASASALEECARAGATVIRHPDNRGIAAALNSGVEQALSADPAPTDILTLDQDSVLPDGYVKVAVAAGASAERAGLRVGMVAPQRVQGLPDRRAEQRDGVLLGGEPIQSGLLIPVRVLRSVGGFDESLVIDGVDTDFYLRCLDAGLVVVIAPGTTLGHRLGAGRPVSVLGHPLVVRGAPVELTHARPFRYYFLVRNRIALVRLHGRRHPRWAAGQVVGLVRHLVLVLTLVPGRRERARSVLHGIRDGIRGGSGPGPAR